MFTLFLYIFYFEIHFKWIVRHPISKLNKQRVKRIDYRVEKIIIIIISILALYNDTTKVTSISYVLDCHSDYCCRCSDDVIMIKRIKWWESESETVKFAKHLKPCWRRDCPTIHSLNWRQWSQGRLWLQQRKWRRRWWIILIDLIKAPFLYLTFNLKNMRILISNILKC